MINSIKAKIKNPYRLFGILSVLFVIACYVVLMLHNGYRFMNSDDASELILSRLLSSEHKLMTKDWIYSTELNVFNTNLVYAPLFHIFSSWKMIRAVGGSIMLLFCAASYIAIPYAWKYDTKWFYLTAFIPLMPYATPWWFFGLKMYYIPHVFTLFISFAALGIIRNSGKNKNIVICTALLSAFAFFTGLGGVRFIEYIFVPLFLASFIMVVFEKSDKKLVFGTAVVMLFSGIGYIINDKVLSKIYAFQSYGEVSFIQLSFEKLEWALDSILESFGYVIGEYFISFGGICNTVAVCLTVIFLLSFILIFNKRKMMSEAQKFMYWYAAIVFILNTFVSVLGQNNEYASRYIAIGMVPTVMFMDLFYKLYISGHDWSRLMAVCMIGAFIVLGAKGYLGLHSYSGNGTRLGYINFLRENGYDYGYATFWNANITTEMSDGGIDMTSLDPNADDLKLYRWLTDRRLLEKEHDRAFLLLTGDELDMYDGSEPIYQDEYFSVFDIDSDAVIKDADMDAAAEE